MKKRILILSVLPILLTAGVLLFLYYNGKFGNHIRYAKKSFNDLPAWQSDNHQQAFYAFQKSCQAIVKAKQDTLFLKSLPASGYTHTWKTICLSAKDINKINNQDAKAFFEKWFEPYQITNNYNPSVLFTGYYLPLIKGSFSANATYSVPVYAVPKDLLKIKIGLFGKSYQVNKPLVGRLRDKMIYPYFDRKEIMQGAIKDTTKPILWTDNLVDLFFAQIQGSAVVQLPNQKKVLIGYGGDNGRPYTPIGKVLISKKIMNKKNVSMQTIRTWLMNHPEAVNEVLNQDASFVFFTLMKTDEAIGTEGVPLTHERSLAVDTQYVPLGAPIWLTTTIPTLEGKKDTFQHLVIAQDTGGAIKDMHGDIYWGAGGRASFIAGGLKNKGKWWILLPRNNEK